MSRIGIESSVSPFLKMSFETATHFLTDATLKVGREGERTDDQASGYGHAEHASRPRPLDSNTQLSALHRRVARPCCTRRDQLTTSSLRLPASAWGAWLTWAQARWSLSTTCSAVPLAALCSVSMPRYSAKSGLCFQLHVVKKESNAATVGRCAGLTGHVILNVTPIVSPFYKLQCKAVHNHA